MPDGWCRSTGWSTTSGATTSPTPLPRWCRSWSRSCANCFPPGCCAREPRAIWSSSRGTRSTSTGSSSSTPAVGRRWPTGGPARPRRRCAKRWSCGEGPALAEFEEPFARLEEGRLAEQHLTCLEERIEAELMLGHHAQLVAELDGLVRRHPLRERLRGQLMLALYRCGRQAEALEVFTSFRRMLEEELGIDPSPRLKVLERRMLQQDASLDPASEQTAAVAHRLAAASRWWRRSAAASASSIASSTCSWRRSPAPDGSCSSPAKPGSGRPPSPRASAASAGRPRRRWSRTGSASSISARGSRTCPCWRRWHGWRASRTASS